jgi:spore maturation protein SpmA
MALSRIWSAFIIIAILTAAIKTITSQNDKAVFTAMVTGKSGDTIKIKTSVLTAADTISVSKTNPIGPVKKLVTADEKLLTYKIQSSDGILETCQSAVTICLKLIGFLTLFMGFSLLPKKQVE